MVTPRCGRPVSQVPRVDRSRFCLEATVLSSEGSEVTDKKKQKKMKKKKKEESITEQMACW